MAFIFVNIEKAFHDHEYRMVGSKVSKFRYLIRAKDVLIKRVAHFDRVPVASYSLEIQKANEASITIEKKEIIRYFLKEKTLLNSWNKYRGDTKQHEISDELICELTKDQFNHLKREGIYETNT